MTKRIEKFLEFNGRRLSLLSVDGTWFIAIKPICEVLGIKYEHQFERLQSHKILGQLFRKHGMVAADKRMREMVCLPEKVIYGWLFSINSDSPELINYQWKCYEVLYDHFHGALTGRMNALGERSDTEIKIHELQERLNEKLLGSEEFLQIQELKQKQKDIAKTLKQLDVDLMAKQLSLEL